MAYQYIAKATLAEDVETYVKREADDELYHALVQGEICNVFNSRKTGKSSLAVRTIKRLRDEAGFKSVVIDFSLNDTQLDNPDQWYASMLDPLAFELNLDVNLKTWQEERNWLTPLRRFRQFIETILLRQVPDFIVIFLDEIDSVLSFNLPTDDFFAFIRGCYNLRATKPEYKRLTFCLLGVVTVSDLIKDKRRTPFNIGQAIELKGFTLEEAAPVLTKGLEGKFPNNSTAILEQIIKLTGGQPFLTQKLCQRVLEYAEIANPNIDEIAQTYIIDNWEAQDNPELLRTIRNRLISEQVQNRSGRLLSIYQEILTCGKISADSSGDQMELQLTGLVVKENGHLKVYNRIYKEVFNLKWVQQELAKLRPYQENFDAWIESAKKDDSRLLRGQSLDEALKWKEGKRLSDDDTAFLDASQRYERDDLRQAKAKAKDLIKAAQEGTKIEIAGAQALLRSNTETELFQALCDAKDAGEELQELLKKWENLVKDDSELSAESPATSPLLALQTILSKIQEETDFFTGTGHSDWITSISFSPNGKYLATGSEDNTAKLWLMKSKAEIHTFIGHNDRVTSVSFSPNGKYLATASKDGTVKLWSIKTKAEIHTFTGHTNSVWSVSFSPDGKYLATGSSDNTAKLWSIKTKAELHTFIGHTDWVWSVSFSPDGKYLATGSEDKTAKLWSIKLSTNLSIKSKVKHRIFIRTFNAHTRSVTSVSFSPYGKYLATGSEDNTAKLWSIETQAELYTFRGHTKSIWSVSFSPNGKYLATGSQDKTVKVWSMKVKAELHTFTCHSMVKSVRFSPDSNYLATAFLYGKEVILLSIKDELHTFT